MKLYEVIFNRNEGGIAFLVRAPDHLLAVREVANNASPSDHNGKRFPKADVIHEIGVDSAVGQVEERILRGPYIQPAYNHSWKRWIRVLGENCKDTNEWEEK